ncbi:MAG: hypothetical protein ACLU9S_00665 [Oscillospiraceae bacterium]
MPYPTLIETTPSEAGSLPGSAPRSSSRGDESAPGNAGLQRAERGRELLEHSIIEMEHDSGMDRNAALAAMRYDFIEKVAAESVVKAHESREHRRSMRIDAVLTNRFAAPAPPFLGIAFWCFTSPSMRWEPGCRIF